jgi:hypothetical protein
MSESPRERRGRYWTWYAAAGVLIIVGGFLGQMWLFPGYGYALIVGGLVLWIIYVLLDGFSPIERARKKCQDDPKDGRNDA